MKQEKRPSKTVKAVFSLVFFALSVLSGLLSAGIPALALEKNAFLPETGNERRSKTEISAGRTVDDKEEKEEETRYLIPCGIPFGVRFYTDGALVSRVEEGSPADRAGIAAGDVILSLDGAGIKGAAEWLYAIRGGSEEKRLIEWTRDGRTRKASFEPDGGKSGADAGNGYLGIHVRDCLAGIGTLTVIDPNTRRFAGLGHGICRDSGAGLLPLGRGSICGVRITSVLPGAPGAPGQLRGSFCPGQTGRLTENTTQGVFGQYGGELPQRETLPTATQKQVREGSAQILCALPDGIVKAYGVTIEKILSFDPSGRNYLLRVTDGELIEKTGGIVQGMSGSPILQDGRIIGAVTHVLVEDPTKGYGIFIGNMLDSL